MRYRNIAPLNALKKVPGDATHKILHQFRAHIILIKSKT